LQSTLHKTSIFITHDFAEALKLGDHIAIMRHGQFVQVGTPQDLVLNPKNDYVNAFVKDAPRAKVLTAAAIMAPQLAGGNGSPHPTVRADASLEEVMPVVVESETPVAVVDGTGKALGYVDRKAIIKALMLPE
jgi:glycine betaine/proline transport system ATP-binding protein